MRDTTKKRPIDEIETARLITGRFLETMCDYVRRRGWDSNPRWVKTHNGFRDRPIRPLWHLSNSRLALNFQTKARPVL